jgi:hypothetical protein
MIGQNDNAVPDSGFPVVELSHRRGLKYDPLDSPVSPSADAKDILLDSGGRAPLEQRRVHGRSRKTTTTPTSSPAL